MIYIHENNSQHFDLGEIYEYADEKGQIGIDLETSGLRPFQHRLHLIAIGDQDRQWVINYHTADVDYDPLIEMLEDGTITKVAHNAIFDCLWLTVKLHCRVRNVYDTLTMEKVVRGGRWLGDMDENAMFGMKKYGLDSTLQRWKLAEPLLKDLRKEFIGYEGTEFRDELVQYASDDIEHLITLKGLQMGRVEKLKLHNVVKLEKKFTEVLVSMMYHGVDFDLRKWLQIYEENKVELEKAHKYLRGKHFINWNSPKKVLELFQSMKLRLSTTDSNDIRYYLRDADDIKKGERNLLERLLVYRDYKKKVTTYGANIVHSIDGDMAIRGNFNQLLATGRISSMKPNLQQIPSDSAYRECFRARAGHKLVCADYSSQELVILATLSGEQSWLDTIGDGKDLHSLSAAMVFGSKWVEAAEEDCQYFLNGHKCSCPRHKVLRDQAKTLTFGLSYGLTAKTFALRMGLSEYAAQNLYTKYFVSFKKVKKFLDKAANEATGGNVYTMEPFGRWRYVNDHPEYRKRNMGKNTTIQGTAADMMKLAAVKIFNRDMKLLLLVHDEVIVEAPIGEQNAIAEEVKACMEEAGEIILGHDLLRADPIISDVWTKG